MSRILRRLMQLPFHLVLIGVALGLIARAIYPPKTDVIAPRQFEEVEVEFTDLPLSKADSQ